MSGREQVKGRARVTGRRINTFGWKRQGLMVWALLLGTAFGSSAHWEQGPFLPDTPGKAETQKLCSQCHEIDKSLSPRQDRAAWAATVEKMVSFGMRASDDETRLVIEYLARHFPADDVPPIHVNTAAAIQFESGLSLRRSQAMAIIRYREAHGKFRSLEDLLKVPGIDTARIEAKRDRLVFD